MLLLRLATVILFFGVSEILGSVQGGDGGCVPRDYGHGSVVCVCTADRCDLPGKVTVPSTGIAVVYETTKSGTRFQSRQAPFGSQVINGIPALQINASEPNKDQQPIIGFGGAFTDASGINIASLPKDMQSTLIRSYFSSEGLDYNVGRIPIASCDFSTHSYSYDDVENDFELKSFKLAPEDVQYKIPYIKAAQKFKTQEIFLFGSPWSSPAWMKTNKKTYNGGALIGEPGGKYYKTWAQYFVKFLQAYEKFDISMWGLTVENEPSAGFDPTYKFQCLAFNSTMERDFVKLDLGPALRENGYSKLQLMINDDQRGFVKDFAETIIGDPEAAQYVAGTAVHWYGDAGNNADVFDEVKASFPEKFILATEACAGWRSSDQPKVSLGDWSRGEMYAHSIMEDLQHSVAGWVDWNLALDPQGGPNWVENFVDSPVIVNATAKEVYYQPTYYALAHFSKFITRGSQRMFWMNQDGVEVVGFKRTDGRTVFVIFNNEEKSAQYQINDPKQGTFINSIPGKTIQTVLY